MTESHRVAAREAAVPGPLNPLLTGPGEYPFITLERKRRELCPQGIKVINFSICCTCIGAAWNAQ